VETTTTTTTSTPEITEEVAEDATDVTEITAEVAETDGTEHATDVVETTTETPELFSTTSEPVTSTPETPPEVPVAYVPTDDGGITVVIENQAQFAEEIDDHAAIDWWIPVCITLFVSCLICCAWALLCPPVCCFCIRRRKKEEELHESTELPILGNDECGSNSPNHDSIPYYWNSSRRDSGNNLLDKVKIPGDAEKRKLANHDLPSPKAFRQRHKKNRILDEHKTPRSPSDSPNHDSIPYYWNSSRADSKNPLDKTDSDIQDRKLANRDLDRYLDIPSVKTEESAKKRTLDKTDSDAPIRDMPSETFRQDGRPNFRPRNAPGSARQTTDEWRQTLKRAKD